MITTPTIYALSSGRPPAAIAVIRISGPRAGDALRALAGRLPQPRQAMFAVLRDPQSGEPIDEALALWFPGPRSETGEDTAELQIHGGRAVIAATFAALARIEGLRPAEAGEFTRRAFENGRLDLTRVEALADLVGADSEMQRRQALRQMRGLLGGRAEAWRQRLVAALALAEAQIDFPDEGDVPQDAMPAVRAEAAALREEIAAVLATAKRGERLRDGFAVAIAGPPNAGKSSLLNRLARREAAIVSPFAGTTRDVIEVHLDIDGYPVVLLDTAGIRDSDDPVEQEGVRRARARAAEADLVLWVVDGAAPVAPEQPEAAGTAVETWTILNKADLHPPAPRPTGRWFAVSALRGDGIDDLVTALAGHLAATFGAAEPALVTRERQRGTLADAASALGRAAAAKADELVAEELRLAARALGRLTGRVDVEDVLDAIFRDFCIGK